MTPEENNPYLNYTSTYSRNPNDIKFDTYDKDTPPKPKEEKEKPEVKTSFLDRFKSILPRKV